MNLSGHHSAATELCKALGLDPKNTRGIRFRMRAEDLAILTVESYLTVENAQKLIPIFKRFNLVEIESSDESVKPSDI